MRWFSTGLEKGTLEACDTFSAAACDARRGPDRPLRSGLPRLPVAAPRSTSRDLALVATFAGVVAALGLVPAFTPPGFTVPITAQSLGVMLAGAILGARRGFLSLALLLVLVAVGLPLLAGGRGGLGVFADPVGRVPARLAGRGVRRGLADRARRADVPAPLGDRRQRARRDRGALRRRASPGSPWSPGSRCRPRPSSTLDLPPRRPGQGRGRAPSSRAACTRPTRGCSAAPRGRDAEPTTV